MQTNAELTRDSRSPSRHAVNKPIPPRSNYFETIIWYNRLKLLNPQCLENIRGNASKMTKKTKELGISVDESDARRALRDLGIPPNKGLIRAWLQAARAEELSEEESSDAPSLPPRPSPTARPSAPGAPKPRHPRGYSKSQLEPVLRKQGTLERQPGRRKRGRPRVIASWFKQVADTMTDGSSLRFALKHNGLTLDAAQIRALYRNIEFRRFYQEARSRRLLTE